MSTAAATAVVKTRILARERDELARLAELHERSVASLLRRLIRDELAAHRNGGRADAPTLDEQAS